MNLRILLLLGMLLPALTHAQTNNDAMERLMTRRALHCEDISYNCTSLLPQYYYKQKKDTIPMLLQYWRDKCGDSEPLTSFDMLWRIRQGLPLAELPKFFFAYVRQYASRFNKEVISNEHPYSYYYREPEAIYNGYYPALMKIALELQQQRKNLQPDEDLLLRFYATGDKSLLDELETAQYNGTALQTDYRRYKEVQRREPNTHASVEAGLWTPIGKNKVWGNHPYIGLNYGARVDRLFGDLHFAIRFVRAPEDYLVRWADTLRKTDYFSSGNLGFNLGCTVTPTDRKTDLSLVLGLGWDFTSVIKSESRNRYDNGDKGKTLSSFTACGGLLYRIYFKGTSYLGLQARYQLLFYNNKGGSDLHGDAISVGLVYGGYTYKTNTGKFRL